MIYNQSGAPTGSITIGGLPYPASSDTGYFNYSPMHQNQTGAAWFTELQAGNTAFIIDSDTANDHVTCAGANTGRTFNGSIVYRVD